MAKREVTGWVGWVYFAAFFLLLQGIFHAIAGLVALFNSDLIIAGPSNVWLVDLTTWGWVYLIVGVVLFLAGLALFTGQTWAIVTGVVVAGLSAIANFAFIPVYPVWSILILTLDIVVIYALIAHGQEVREDY
jgi:hypothetical protein